MEGAGIARSASFPPFLFRLSSVLFFPVLLYFSVETYRHFRFYSTIYTFSSWTVELQHQAPSISTAGSLLIRSRFDQIESNGSRVSNTLIPPFYTDHSSRKGQLEMSFMSHRSSLSFAPFFLIFPNRFLKNELDDDIQIECFSILFLDWMPFVFCLLIKTVDKKISGYRSSTSNWLKTGP